MTKKNAPQSVTRLFGLGLTPGKLLALQRISNPNGTFTMLALDQNSSILKMAAAARAKQGRKGEPSYEDIVLAKSTIARLVGPQASAVLLDTVYGAWQAIASWSFPKAAGLLVRLEKSGSPTMDDPRGGKLTVIEPGWSVSQIKQMGAQAVKFLVPFEPTHIQSAERQFELVREVHQQCQYYDILLLLEAVSYPFKGEDKTSKNYLDRKGDTVIETARQLSPWCDVYKAEFPGTLGHESDAKLKRNIKALNDASTKPWVLLSAGVDFPDYEKQVRMATDGGANGVLGGRAFWKEYFDKKTQTDRERFCTRVAAKRVAKVSRIVQTQGTPWFQRYGLTMADLKQTAVAEGWYFRYGGELDADMNDGEIDTSGAY